MKPKNSFKPDSIGAYFRMEWLPLAFIVLSGLVYNIGLVAMPWFEGKLAQTLSDILGGNTAASAMVGVKRIDAFLAQEDAARLAGLDGVIRSFPKGYDAPCTDGMFSQGEWQLLSIARAAAADPKVLLLDEITANLDAET